MKNVDTIDDAIPADVRADAAIVVECLVAGRPVPPDVVKRIRARSERITQEVFEKYGLLDIGVPAIRELRGELPEP
jgi:hypothetical protein